MSSKSKVKFSLCRLEYRRGGETDILIGSSVERIAQYVAIEQEPKPTEDGNPPAFWPSSGDLKVENMSARYSVVRTSDYGT